MNQRSAMLQTIKRELKSQELTYRQVAHHLQLSENSIKRLFSEQNTSLDRLEQLCELAGISLIELVKKMEIAANRVELLSAEQEQLLVSDMKLLLVSICVLHYWQFEEIVNHYRISEPECIRLMAKLDRLKIIELQPLNRVRLIVSNNFRWRENGPVQRFFREKVQQEFFRSDFSKPGEKLFFMSGMLSRESHQRMEKQIHRLANDFNERHRDDAALPLDQRFGSSMVVAVRAWEFSAFNALRRSTNNKVF